MNYDLVAVVDPDGLTNTLHYTSSDLLSEVDNPYGLKATFKYATSNGNLTNIVDAIGMPSSITATGFNNRSCSIDYTIRRKTEFGSLIDNRKRWHKTSNPTKEIFGES